MLLYNHLMHDGNQANAMLKRYPIAPLKRLEATPACRMVGQILHVKKGSRVSVYTRGTDKAKKNAKAYDRLIFLRDLVSGKPFVVISESKQESVVMFHCETKIGDYVTLYLPKHSTHTVADIPVVRYRDVFFPLTKLPCNKMVSSVPQGAKFATFATEVDRKDFTMTSIGVENVCAGQTCDGTAENPCPCLGGTSISKQALSFEIKVPVRGLEDNYARYRSISFTKYFFGSTVMKQLYAYNLDQLEDVLTEGMQHVEKVIVAGWVGYTADADDDIGIATNTHVTSIKLTFRKNENGEFAFRPNNDLKLPVENVEEDHNDGPNDSEDDSDTDSEEQVAEVDSDDSVDNVSLEGANNN